MIILLTVARQLAGPCWSRSLPRQTVMTYREKKQQCKSAFNHPGSQALHRNRSAQKTAWCLRALIIRTSPHTLQDTCTNQESSQAGNNPRTTYPRTPKDFPSSCLICKATSSAQSTGLSLKLVALLKTR